jgi:hypothetical protein
MVSLPNSFPGGRHVNRLYNDIVQEQSLLCCVLVLIISLNIGRQSGHPN